MPTDSPSIVITNARVNNLKNVSCRIPHAQLTVITGPSGSGKSSLAFDTLYAEGQRRFVESMSSYARQFLERLEKPDVDKIEHILPAIALGQNNGVKNARSTVGTATEITDYLRLLYSTVGLTHCMVCGGLVQSTEPTDLANRLAVWPAGHKLMLLAPVAHPSTAQLLERGFFRVERNGELMELDANSPSYDALSVVVDRWISKPDIKPRLLESIRTAYQVADGVCELVDLTDGSRHTWRQGFRCVDCGESHTPLTPHLFSFNSPLGACPECEGFGRAMAYDADKVIPNPDLTLAQGAIHPFGTAGAWEMMDLLLGVGKRQNIRLTVPYHELSEAEQAFVWQGSGRYPGISGFFSWLETQKYKVHVRVLLSKYRMYVDCPTCQGSRLRPQALTVTVGDLTIADVSRLPVRDMLAWATTLQYDQERDARKTERLLSEIRRRLTYLDDVGLGYLSLHRQMRTLSGGEAQRIHLSSALGSALTETLYVLDEPTVGLHARDTARLLSVLRNLCDTGNTVVMVEHDPDMILGADYAIELGPEGGDLGGRLIFEGRAADLLKTPYTALAAAMSQRLQAPFLPDFSKPDHESGEWVEIVGARGHNLQHMTVRFPKQQLVCVTGVSGSGKSTLIKHTLYAGYQHRKGEELQLEETPCDAMTGLEGFADVLLVDQSPPARSTRSNAATYTNAYDPIRSLFAATRQANLLGLKPGDFSFNAVGGRCETCEGLGYQVIDMQFMADVTVVCPDCKGRRFQSNVLSCRWPDEATGKNIDEVLGMTIQEAVRFFTGQRKIIDRLKPLMTIGLGYLTLGQPTSTLSGGEAQRLKLAEYLADKQKSSLFLFDEPTTGLHLRDIQVLVAALRQLIEAGHSVVVIEHHLDLIAQADYIFDLGPEGGDQGGQLLYEGSLRGFLADVSKSVTAASLRQWLIQRDQPVVVASTASRPMNV